MEYNFNENDQRNPSSIADTVGDLVGDLVGSLLDLIASYGETLSAVFVSKKYK